MALQVGELYGMLELDSGPFDKAMGGVKGKLSGLGGMVGKAAAGVGVVLAGAFTAAAGAGVKANSDTEQFMATMEVLTGSTEKASEELAKLKKFAATTPFGMEDLKQGELTMRAVGVSTEKWRDTIGDTAAAFQSTGKSYNDVVDAIADAQTGELERLKEFGITKQQIVDYSNDVLKKSNIVNAKGQITDQEAFNDALLGLMDSRYDGMMDKQSKTMAGMLGTFKDFMSQGLEIMSKPIFDALKKGMEVVLPALESMMDSGLFEKIGTQVAGFVDMVMSGFSKIGPIISGFVTQVMAFVSSGSGAFGSFRENIAQFGAVFAQIFQGLVGIVTSVLGFIWPHIQSVIGMILSFWRQNGAELLANFQIVFQGILAVIQFVMPVVKFIIDTVFSAVKMIISGALTFIMGVFRVFAGLLTGDWSKMWSGVKDVLMGAIQFILGLMSLNFVRGLLNLFKNLGVGALNYIKSMGSGIVRNFEAFVNQLIAGSIRMVTNVLNWFRNMGSQAARIFGILRGFGESIFRAMFNTIRSVVSNMVASVRNQFSSMANAVREKATGIYNTVKSVFSRMKSAITSPIDAAKAGVSRAIGGIKSLFSGLRLKLPSIKVPRFSIKNWSSNPKDWLKAMPSVGISWHKDGGIFNGPTVAGLGEAGAEAIVPLSGQRMRPFAREIARQMGGFGGGGGPFVLNAKLVLPDGRVIAEIAEPHIENIQDMKKMKTKRGWGEYA